MPTNKPPLQYRQIFHPLSIFSLYILFILSLNPKVFLLCYWIRNSDVSVHNKLCTLYILRGRVTSPFRKEWGQFWQKCDALNFWLPFSANLTKPWCVWVKMCIQLQHLSHLASSQTVSIRIYNSTSLSNISSFSEFRHKEKWDKWWLMKLQMTRLAIIWKIRYFLNICSNWSNAHQAGNRPLPPNQCQ